MFLSSYATSSLPIRLLQLIQVPANRVFYFVMAMLNQSFQLPILFVFCERWRLQIYNLEDLIDLCLELELREYNVCCSSSFFC